MNINSSTRMHACLATKQHNMRSLRVLSCGAAPLGSTLLHAVRAALKNVSANVHVTQGPSHSLLDIRIC